MQDKKINWVCGFDVGPGGAARPVQGDWPTPEPEGDQTYRWLHFDLNDASLQDWAQSHLPGAAATALLQAETRPRCDWYETGLILNLRGVNQNPGADPEDMVSLRMWITPRCVISARMRKVWAADDLRQAMEKQAAPVSVGQFAADLAYGLSKRIEAVSLGLEEDTDALEEAVLTEGAAAEEVATLPQLRARAIKLRRFVRPQEAALAALSQNPGGLLDKRVALHLRETVNRATRTLEELESTSDRLLALQDQLDVLTANALGRNSYVLSVVAAIFLPLGFLTGLFGVNVGGMPGIDAPMAFAILCGSSVVLGVVLFLLFRFLKWL